MRFEKIININDINKIDKIENLNQIDQEIIKKAYSLFCIDFVNQLKEDYRFSFELNKNPIDKEEKEFSPFFRFSIDMPRRKKKKGLPIEKISIKHAKVEPFNTDIKEGVK